MITVYVGGAVTLKGTVYDVVGNVVTGETVTYSSSDPTIASVDSVTGVLTAVAPGACTITAADGPVTGTLAVTVAPIDFTKVKVIPIGDSFTAGTGASAGKGWADRLLSATTALGGDGTTKFGYSGLTAAYGASQFALDLGPALNLTKINIVPIQFGSNDLINASGGAALGEAYFNGLLQLIGLLKEKRALGYTIVIVLLTPPDCNSVAASGTNYRAAKVMAQAFIRKNYLAMGADILADTAAFWRIGADGAADLTTAPLGLFNADKVHPNDNGHFLIYKRVLGAIYEYYGQTLPTGTAATNLVACFEPGVCAKGLGTYSPALMPRQSLTTDTEQTPSGSWGHWDETKKSIRLGPMDIPFTNATGFSVTEWVNLTAADIAAAERRGLYSDVGNAAMLITRFNSGKWAAGVFYGNDTANFDLATTPSVLSAGIHTVGFTFDPTLARGSRITLYVDGSPIASPALAQNGVSLPIGRPTGQWGEEVIIGDNQFQGSAPLDNHQAVDFLTATGVLTNAQMLARSQYLLGRWQASVT